MGIVHAEPLLRIVQLVQTGKVLGALPGAVQRLHAVAVEDRPRELLAALVLLQLEVEPRDLPEQRLQDPALPAPAAVGLLEVVVAAQQAPAGQAHHEVAVTLHQRHRRLHAADGAPLARQPDGEREEPRQRLPAHLAGQREHLSQHRVHVLAQPGMGGELPGVGHLVQDQPAPQLLPVEPFLVLPGIDVRFHEVEALLAGVGYRLAAHQLGVELAQHPAPQEGEQQRHVAVDAGAAHRDQVRVGDARGLEQGIDGLAQDADVEVEPADARECLEGRHRHDLTADGLQERSLQLGRHAPVLARERRSAGGGQVLVAKPGRGHALDLVPVQEAARAAPGPDDLRHRRHGQAGDDAGQEPAGHPVLHQAPECTRRL